jgi:putative ABC transport system ATP-binding protein
MLWLKPRREARPESRCRSIHPLPAIFWSEGFAPAMFCWLPLAGNPVVRANNFQDSGLMEIVRLQNISKNFSLGKNEIPVLQGINLEVSSGEYVAVMGPSGAGKSTLMQVMGLLTKPTGGQYFLTGLPTADLSQRDMARWRGQKIGFIFQDFQLIEWGSSLYNVTVPLLHSPVARKTREETARFWLEKLGLGHRLGHRPKELSGGEKQRVAIARSLVRNPLLILADEAVGNLDLRKGMEILEIFKEINETGTTIIHVTHNREVAQHAQRVVSLVDGRIT